MSSKRKPAGFVFFEGQEKPRQFVIFGSAKIKGRCESEVFTTSSLQLTYPFLDEDQAEIYFEDGRWMYHNLSEDVFTFVGGKNVPKDGVVPLKDGTIIRLSNERMLTAIFFEEYVSGRDWQIINMDTGSHTVTIADQDAGGAPAIELQYESGHWTMTELNARDVLHNGEEVDEEVRIRIDDCIQIADTKFYFEGSGLVYGYPSQNNTLSINIDERSAHQAMKKVTLLRDINLSIEPGNMVLILGGSGAGKSTFVNAVTGYEKAKATIKGGDIDFYQDYDRVKYMIGFVPQDTLMREDDTVFDTVMNAAEMRLPQNMSEEDKKKRVAAVLRTFGLEGREKTKVSKLSGGQKKRLSISMEFVSSPSLFILDEPDSGLDGIMATELMENLRLIACQGRIVMVITHAPDRVAHLFDKVIVLAKSTADRVGQLAFYGGIQEARDFFGVSTMEEVVRQINPVNEGGAGRADYFIEKYKTYSEQRDQSRKAAGAFRQLGAPDEPFTPTTPYPGDRGGGSGEVQENDMRYKNRLEQVPVYLGKLFRMFINEKNWKVLPMAAIIAYLVVYVLGNKMFRNMEYTKYGSLALICVCIWNGMFNSIQSVCKERSIIKREHRAGLHISSYLLAHMIYQAVICVLQVLITLVIFKAFGMYFPNTGLVTGVFAIDVFISMFLATYAADMLALMVSCIVHTTTTAMTVVPFLLIVQLVFAGTIFPLNRPTAKTLAKFTISNWGIAAINIAADYNSQKSSVLYTAVGNMKGESPDDMMTKIKNVLEIEEVRDKVETYTASKQQIPEFAYEKDNLLKCWGILAMFAAAYALIGLIALEFIDKDKR